MKQFWFDITAWQFLQGAFDKELVETSKSFTDPAEFAAAFHDVLQGLKSGRIDSIMVQDAAGYAWNIDNGPGRRFKVSEEYSFGFEEDTGPAVTMTEENAFVEIVRNTFTDYTSTEEYSAAA